MITNEIKRQAVIVALSADNSDIDIAYFLRVARSFAQKTRKELKDADSSTISVSEHNIHSARSNKVRTSEFIQQVKQIIDEKRGQ